MLASAPAIDPIADSLVEVAEIRVDGLPPLMAVDPLPQTLGAPSKFHELSVGTLFRLLLPTPATAITGSTSGSAGVRVEPDPPEDRPLLLDHERGENGDAFVPVLEAWVPDAEACEPEGLCGLSMPFE